MLWLKSFHIIFIICWFAGLFYLPRILVYYAASDEPATRRQLAIMARKLYRFVSPFMVLAIGFGAALISTNADYYLHAKWLWLKLLAVVLLVGYHIQCGRYVWLVNNNLDNRSHKFYRFFNELPVILLFLIVILVVVKPF